ncbi:MAG TPA: acetate kinase [Pseudonocardia sp.]|nr:acetate kinase [Pseudonocardia sp.]
MSAEPCKNTAQHSRPAEPVLVINTGSSTIKYQLLEVTGAEGKRLASGLLDRIGDPGSRLVHRAVGHDDLVDEKPVADHEAGFRAVLSAFERTGMPAQLSAVGHRVVHGGVRFDGPVLVHDDVLATIRELTPLAPLHNPANALGIEVTRRLYPDLPQVAVFDTAFHRTMPARAYRYALPRELADRYGIRRFGFHGTSHQYVSRRAAEHLGRPLEELALITLHLGNGASAAAVAGGRCIDTSMGLTPLAGLVMGTRSGDVDPAVVFHLHREAGLGFDEIETLLTKQSGLVGLAGAGDVREIRARIAAGDTDAAEALDIFCYRVRGYVGAYAAALGRVDAIVFTAGIGENDPAIRAAVCEGLAGYGVVLDAERNTAAVAGARAVSVDDARVPVLVVPTDEELEIARQTLAVASG